MDVADQVAERLAHLPGRLTCTLTHYGRKSGAPYRVTVWFTVDRDHVNVHTMSMERQWVRNVLVTPRVRVQVGDETLDGELTPVTAADEMQRVVKLMQKKYPIVLPYLWWKGQPPGAFRLSVDERRGSQLERGSGRASAR